MARDDTRLLPMLVPHKVIMKIGECTFQSQFRAVEYVSAAVDEHSAYTTYPAAVDEHLAYTSYPCNLSLVR